MSQKTLHCDKPQGSDDIDATIDSISGSSSDEAFTGQPVTYIDVADLVAGKLASEELCKNETSR